MRHIPSDWDGQCCPSSLFSGSAVAAFLLFDTTAICSLPYFPTRSRLDVLSIQCSLTHLTRDSFIVQANDGIRGADLFLITGSDT